MTVAGRKLDRLGWPRGSPGAGPDGLERVEGTVGLRRWQHRPPMVATRFARRHGGGAVWVAVREVVELSDDPSGISGDRTCRWRSVSG